MSENHPQRELGVLMKAFNPEQIVTPQQQIEEVKIANGKTTPQTCKEGEITVQSFYRSREELGELKLN